MTTFDAQRLDELRRAVLEERVRAGAPDGNTESVSRTSHLGPTPLSVSQNQLWYLNQLAPESRAYNELVAIRKSGSLDVGAVRRALTEIVRRHEALRTTFCEIDGVPHQIVNRPTEIDVPFLDLSHLDPAEAEQQAIDIVAADTAVPYDLARGPLMRARLVRIADDDHRLFLGLHHLIFDGVTLYGVLWPEFTALYRSYSTGRTPSLPDPQAQYSDYTVWEREWVAGTDVASRIARWRSRLAGLTPASLPTDHPRRRRHRSAGGTIPLDIDQRTVEGLREAAGRVGGTLFHALAAAHAWWLHSYTESGDAVFGTPHDLRYRKDLLTAAGYCVTPLVVRCAVSGHETFTGLVERIRVVVTDAVSDAVPFETLIGELAVERDPRNNPLFQTALVLRPPLTSPTDEWSLHLMEYDVSDVVAATKFDISMHLDEQPDGHLAGGFFFSSDLFDRESAREMARNWTRLLDAIARAPDTPIADHDLVTPDEQERQLAWNPPAPQHDSFSGVYELIRKQVDLTPDAVAVQVGDEALTYRELDERASAIASKLTASGAGPGAVVALQLDRTPDLVASVLGTLKSGAAFLPLDPREPAERNNFSINDAGATVVLTDRVLNELLSQQSDSGTPAVTVSPDDLAYVIYTSGSTGRPKGVLVEHRSVTNAMNVVFGEFGVTAFDTVVSVTSISFDIALLDMLCALSCGARLVLATADQAMDPVALARLISTAGATYMLATPTTWAALVGSGWSGDRRLMAVSGGETLTDALAESLLRRCGEVWNAWGPTEATIITGAARLSLQDTITVGTPIPGVRVYVLDSRGRMQPVGVPGEIAIGGVGVARGYLNRPDEETRRFVRDPFVGHGSMYLTGDRGRFLPDGRLQHLGRYDNQLKIRGFRVEPGEIEASLCEHPSVTACAVVARETSTGETQLVAYVVDEHRGLAETEVREWLRRRVPEYMVPSAFVELDAFPTTAGGKVDKAALPPPRPSVRAGDLHPRNDAERRVAALWTDLLGVPVTDVNTDFFDLGGHSMLAARLMFELQRTYGSSLSLATFLDRGRTVAKLAELLGTSEVDERSEGEAGQPPMYFVYPDIACAMSLRHFAAGWGPSQPVYPLILEQPTEPFDRSLEVQRLARQLSEAIRERQPLGPYALAGYSLGAIVAYELAGQLAEAGAAVNWLGIFDTAAPPLQRLMSTPWARLRRLQNLPAAKRWRLYCQLAFRIIARRLSGPALTKQYDAGIAREITCRYDRPGHAVPMQLFVAEDSATQVDAYQLGWDDYHAGPLTVHRFPGSHEALLDQPSVVEVAWCALESLRDAQTVRTGAWY